MKIYIFADMEGCSGISNSEYITGNKIALGASFMAQDINACIAGCFEAGAKEVIVRDGHGGGVNLDPSQIDPRATLIQGATPGERFPDIEGAAGLILLGYHAMAGTEAAVLEHSYSSKTIQNMWLNDRKVGEIGIDAAIAAEHKVPVILVTGDDKACKEAVERLLERDLVFDGSIPVRYTFPIFVHSALDLRAALLRTVKTVFVYGDISGDARQKALKLFVVLDYMHTI